MKLIISILITFVCAKIFASEALCVFDHKDYTSAGFSLPFRKGLHINGRFGCEYICACKGKTSRVMHVLVEKHFDADFSNGTGGPSRAKWFICPFSVKSDSWKPIYDVDRYTIIAYSPEIDYTPRLASWYDSIQIKNWSQSQCQ